jgi:ATP-dependent Clp protease ATP-binding subunit ClpC
MSQYNQINTQCRRLIQIANQEAINTQSKYISSGHLLLALLDADSDPVAKFLISFGAQSQRVRVEVIRLLAMEDDTSRGEPRMISVVSHMLDVARSLNRDSAGSEHLLIGLLHDRNDIAVRALEAAGVFTRYAPNEPIPTGTSRAHTIDLWPALRASHD